MQIIKKLSYIIAASHVFPFSSFIIFLIIIKRYYFYLYIYLFLLS